MSESLTRVVAKVLYECAGTPICTHCLHKLLPKDISRPQMLTALRDIEPDLVFSMGLPKRCSWNGHSGCHWPDGHTHVVALKPEALKWRGEQHLAATILARWQSWADLRLSTAELIHLCSESDHSTT